MLFRSLISASENSFSFVKGKFSVCLLNTHKEKVYGSSVMEGINIPNINEDVTTCYIFNKSDDIKRHRSKLLEGAVYEDKHIFLQLDYPKTKFKGKVAIDIVKNVLGYNDVDEIDKNFRNEYFDDFSYNNNRAIQYNPQDIFLLQKKRYQEGIRAMENPEAKTLKKEVSQTVITSNNTQQKPRSNLNKKEEMRKRLSSVLEESKK